MRKLGILVSLIVLSAGLFAQESEAPKVVLFGGYSYLRSGNSTNSSLGFLNNSSNHFNGWDGQATFNFAPHFGLTADFNGNYRTPVGFSALGFSAGTNQTMYNLLFGPTVSTNFGRFGVFGHALFGESLSRLSTGVSVPILGGIGTNVSSSNSFAMAFGGGVDVGLTRHIAIRAAQLDYLRTQYSPTEALAFGLSTNSNSRQNSFRYSGGIVFNF
jgi:peptidoglycan-associated lipoprotein